MVSSPFELMDVEYDPHETQVTKTNTASEGALTEEEFEELIAGARDLDPIYDMIAEFIIVSMGRLGLRLGELVHMKESWVDFDEQWINIPAHEKCTMGKDGGICGQCRQQAKQMAKTNDLPIEETEKLYWKAKTARAKRSVPYSFNDRFVNIVNKYFDEYDEFRGSYSAVRRRIDKAAEASNLDTYHVKPHSLRATAATYHAGTGIDVWTLQAMMGWAYANTAEHYIVNSAKRTRLVLEEHH